MSTATGHGGSPSIALEDEYWWYAARSRMLETFLARYAAGATHALDVGSADAPSAAWFRRSVPHPVALDLDPRGLTGDAVCGSADALPFGEACFDVVGAFDVIEHLPSEEAVLGEIARVLRPGGRLLVSVPAYQWAWTDFDTANGHHRRYTRPGLIAAVERAGFGVERASYAFATVFPMFAAERIARRVRGPRHTEALDVVPVPSLPGPVQTGLRALCRIDERILRRGTLPFGSSVFLAATKRG